jgi:hypothetical protein
MPQTQQPQRREFKLADTIDYIGRYTAHLLRMKAQGKSNGEMLSYLHTRGIQANLGDIAEFWQGMELKKQKQQQQQSGQQKQEQQQNQHRHGGPSQNASVILQHCPELFQMRAEGKKTEDLLSYLQSIGVHTTFGELLRTMNLYREWLAEKAKERAEQNTRSTPHACHHDGTCGSAQKEAAPENEEAETQGQEIDGEDHPPMAGKIEGELAASKCSEGGAAKLMARFERILDQKFDDYDFGTDRSPANLKDINMMMRTVMSYEKDQARQEYRKELLKIKKADQEIRAKKAKQAEARQKAADNNSNAEDFDNTEDIAHMRKESFREVDEYLASGEVDDKIVEAKRKAKAAGAKVEEYVPPPLGTGLWSKPAPAPAPGSPPGQTNSAGSATANVAGTTTPTASTAPHPSG